MNFRPKSSSQGSFQYSFFFNSGKALLFREGSYFTKWFSEFASNSRWLASAFSSASFCAAAFFSISVSFKPATLTWQNAINLMGKDNFRRKNYDFRASKLFLLFSSNFDDFRTDSSSPNSSASSSSCSNTFSSASCVWLNRIHQEISQFSAPQTQTFVNFESCWIRRSIVKQSTSSPSLMVSSTNCIKSGNKNRPVRFKTCQTRWPGVKPGNPDSKASWSESGCSALSRSFCLNWKAFLLEEPILANMLLNFSARSNDINGNARDSMLNGCTIRSAGRSLSRSRSNWCANLGQN